MNANYINIKTEHSLCKFIWSKDGAYMGYIYCGNKNWYNTFQKIKILYIFKRNYDKEIHLNKIISIAKNIRTT